MNYFRLEPLTYLLRVGMKFSPVLCTAEVPGYSVWFPLQVDLIHIAIRSS